MKRIRLSTTILALAMVGCTPAADTGEAETETGMQADAEAAREAIRAVVDDFLAAFNAGDVQAAAPLYTGDIVQLAPDGPVLEGRAATVQALEDFLAQFPSAPTQTATTDEVTVHGDIAIARGTWTVRQTPAEGEEQVRNGKWLTVHQRQPDGSWPISRWIWNEEGTASVEM